MVFPIDWFGAVEGAAGVLIGILLLVKPKVIVPFLRRGGMRYAENALKLRMKIIGVFFMVAGSYCISIAMR